MQTPAITPLCRAPWLAAAALALVAGAACAPGPSGLPTGSGVGSIEAVGPLPVALVARASLVGVPLGDTLPGPSARPTSPVAQPAVSTPPELQTPAADVVWHGRAVRDGYVRRAPTRTAPAVRKLVQGEAVRVAGWVAGEEVERDNPTWAALDDRQFVYSSLLQARAPEGPPAPPTDARTAGKWIDVNLALQVATAYEGRSAVRWALMSTGRPGWETREGTFPILRRVAKETMDGSTLIGEGPTGTGASYRVEDVRYTQYFSRDGSAIHENTWRDPSAFGIPGSHGCIGMLPLEASWFWRWAEVGTPLHIHR